jgi:Zn-dependent protease with chaperone function
MLLWLVLRRCRQADPWVLDLAREVGGRLGLRQKPRVLVHATLSAPFCCLVATVVLPRALLADRSALRAVLAHELAHIAARDPVRRCAFALLAPWLLLHPAWWLLRRLAVQASEEAADARAALALGRVASQVSPTVVRCTGCGCLNCHRLGVRHAANRW